MKESPLFIIIAILLGLAIFATITTVKLRHDLDESKAETQCVLTCNSKEVIYRDGKCGCITWKVNQ